MAWLAFGAPALSQTLPSPASSPTPAEAVVRDAELFARWRQQQAAAVDALEQHLREQGLLGLVPLEELLKSASSWQSCQAEPYAVPPREHWPAVASVLRLVRELTTQGVLGRFEVHSAYRSPALNACAGGARGSAHARSFAIDLTPIDGDDPTPRLCAFWNAQGARWALGLGRYPSGRIHLDTAGHRTWGGDQTGATAVCTRSPAPTPDATPGDRRAP